MDFQSVKRHFTSGNWISHDDPFQETEQTVTDICDYADLYRRIAKWAEHDPECLFHTNNLKCDCGLWELQKEVQALNHKRETRKEEQREQIQSQKENLKKRRREWYASGEVGPYPQS